MKKILLTISVLIGMVLACNAMSVTERIILSKAVETAPISLVSERSVDASLCNNTTSRIDVSSGDYQQAQGAERLAIKALKNIGSFLVKEICRIASSDSQPKPYVSYAGGHYYDARLMVRANSSTMIR